MILPTTRSLPSRRLAPPLCSSCAAEPKPAHWSTEERRFWRVDLGHVACTHRGLKGVEGLGLDRGGCLAGEAPKQNRGPRRESRCTHSPRAAHPSEGLRQHMGRTRGANPRIVSPYAFRGTIPAQWCGLRALRRAPGLSGDKGEQDFKVPKVYTVLNSVTEGRQNTAGRVGVSVPSRKHARLVPPRR